MNTSALAMRLLSQKQYNANLYATASRLITVYSHQISDMLTKYAEIDSNISSILQSFVFLALQSENQSDAQVVKSVTLNVVYADADFSNENNIDNEAVQLLFNLFTVEMHMFKTLESYLQEQAAEDMSALFNIELLTKASKQRARELKALIEDVKNDTFFTKNEEICWHCKQCGYTTKSKTAFTECECCHATREFASA